MEEVKRGAGQGIRGRVVEEGGVGNGELLGGTDGGAGILLVR